jgi:ankyrin repeat protein
MNGRIAVAMAFAVPSAASAFAQSRDFFALVQTGMPQQMQAAIDQGANVKAQDSQGRTPLMVAAQND